MKFYLILSFCFLGSVFAELTNEINEDSAGFPRIYDDKLKDKIIGLFTTIEKMNNVSKILTSENPSLEPFKINLTNLELKGLTSVNINKLSVTNLFKPTLVADMDFKGISIKTDYDISGNLAGALDLYGTGKINANIESGTHFEGKIVIPSIKGNITISQLKASLRFGTMQIKITGLFNDEKLSELISKKLPGVISNTLDQFENEINEFILTSLQTVLEKNPMTLADLINIING